MNRRISITRGLAAAMAFLLFIIVSGSNLMFTFSGVINNALNVSTNKVVDTGKASDTNNIYYGNEFGTDITNKQSTLKVETAVAAENIAQAEEGSVLLKNDNSALPLASGSRITVFGNGSVNSEGTSQGGTAFTAIPAVSFNSALQNALGADNVNLALADNVYKKLRPTSNKEVNEAPLSDVKNYENTWKSDYHDAAVVMLSRTAGESNDDVLTTQDGSHYLGLQANEKDLMNYLKDQKAAGVFHKIIVVVNSDQMMELGWLKDYDVDACLLAGLPGAVGFTGVVNVMMGKVSPSGHIVDTYASNALSAPANTYATSNTQKWTNADAVNTSCADNNNDGANIDYYTIYAEGIYVGYKYYETRYEDCVMGSGNANSTVGSSTKNAWNYNDEVVYPFGYGLSYTSFEQKLMGVNYNGSTDKYEVQVQVTNTGKTAGKSVVEVYAQTPYGDYEKQNGVEKSSVQFVGMEKTGTLAPGESATVTVNVERYMLASYDTKGAKGYILSSGNYYLSIGNNAHDALNNILAAKGFAKSNGMDYDGDKTKTYTWKQADLDTKSYANSRFNDTKVTNAFDFADIKNFYNDFTYLTRSDWAGTYPVEAKKLEATDAIIKDLGSKWYTASSSAPSVSSFKQCATNGLSFSNMRLVDWKDDKTWNSFIDQLTVDEMANLLLDTQGSKAIKSVNMPAVKRGDDAGNLVAVGNKCMSWVSEMMTSRTWNKDRFAARGKLMGTEANYAGTSEIWYGGGDIHRTPSSGRNSQYYSEDGNYGYIVGANEAAAMQKTGTIYCIKHLVLNDQETGRESLSTFSNEQAMREIYLRVFEGAICEGGAQGVMTSFNRLGSRYSATCPSLLTTVLKGEWGFTGHVTTDGYTSGNFYKTHYAEELSAGIDYMCLDASDYAKAIKAAVDGGDGQLLQSLRLAAKHNLYAISRTIAQNGLSSSSMIITVVPWWETLLLVVTGVLTLGFIGCSIALIIFIRSGKKIKLEQEG